MKNNLRKKIYTVYLSLWMAFLITLLVFLYLILGNHLNRQAIESLKERSYSSQLYALRYFRTNDTRRAEKGLERVSGHFAKQMADSEKVRVQILLDGRILADSDMNGGELPMTEDVTWESGDKAYMFSYVKGMKCLSFSSPILVLGNEMGGSSRTGRIRYWYPMEEERTFMIRVLATMGGLSAVMTAVAAALTGKLAEKITYSIRELQDSVSEMQAGNLTRSVRINSNDEMEELGKSFNIMRERMARYIERLDSQTKQVENFYNNVAHQLKTPLSAIIGYSQVIQFEDDLDLICEDAYIIEESGEKLLKSINALLDQARENARDGAVHVSRFSVHEVVEECRNLLKPRLEKMKITMENGCSVGEILQTDREIIKEVMLTVLDNAIIHSECDRITIWCEEKKDKYELHIRDNGCGIEESDRDYIFRVYFQGKRGEGSGSGLGLSICANKMNWIEGEILLNGEITDGTDFVLRFPTIVF